MRVKKGKRASIRGAAELQRLRCRCLGGLAQDSRAGREIIQKVYYRY
jgi:hypothetical protein